MWVIVKKKSDKQKFLLAFISLCHGRSGLGISVSTFFGSEIVGSGVFINSLTHVLMCTHHFVMPVGLRNPLKNHSIMWQVGQFYPCFFRANLVCGFLQQYQRNKGLSNRAGWHSLWCVLSSKQRASKGARSLRNPLSTTASMFITLGGVAGRCLVDKGDRRVRRAAQWPFARCCHAFAVLIMQPSAQ